MISMFNFVVLMAAVGGSVETLSLAGRNFTPAADADISMFLGGSTNEVQANGDGTARLIKTKTPWIAEGFAVSIDDDNLDLEFLQDIIDSNIFIPIAATLASGKVYQGTGQITGDVRKSTNSATATINLMGPEKLTQQ